jgi:hypothetical protein
MHETGTAAAGHAPHSDLKHNNVKQLRIFTFSQELYSELRSSLILYIIIPMIKGIYLCDKLKPLQLSNGQKIKFILIFIILNISHKMCTHMYKPIIIINFTHSEKQGCNTY